MLGRSAVALGCVPEFVPSQVDIQTEAPGFAPQQVEELVTKQVEKRRERRCGARDPALRIDFPGLRWSRSLSRMESTCTSRGRGISERLSELGSTLPAGVGTPKLSPLVSSTMDLLKIGLCRTRSMPIPCAIRRIGSLNRGLLAVPGVAHVNVFGGAVRQIQILPDVRKLASFNVTRSAICRTPPVPLCRSEARGSSTSRPNEFC